MDVAVGNWHGIAARSDGTVVSWGDIGEIPNGETGVVAVAAGRSHSLALKRDGTVVAWGRNDKGQAGPPLGLAEVVAVAAGQAT